MSLDRSAPVFYVRVGNAGSQSKDRVPADIRIESIMFDDEEAKSEVLTLTVNNADLANFDNPLFAIGNVVEACWGYPGAMGKPRESTITKVTGSLKLKVECKGKSHVANLIHRSRTFENMTRSDVARLIAGELGLGAVADIDASDVVQNVIVQARETDLQFLRALAHKEGKDCYVDVNGFHWHARRVGAKPVRTFTWFIGPKSDPGDVESFNIKGDITAKPASVIAAGRDPLTKENFAPYANDASTTGRPTNAPAALVNVSRVGAVDIAGLAKARADAASAGAHVMATTATSKADAQVHANAAFTRSQQKAMKVTLHCVGDALVEAKQTVQLKGFGRVIDGNHHVVSAKHTVGPGYKMVLELTRDGAGAQAGVGANAPATDGKVNDAGAVDPNKPWASVNPDGSVSWQTGGSGG